MHFIGGLQSTDFGIYKTSGANFHLRKLAPLLRYGERSDLFFLGKSEPDCTGID